MKGLCVRGELETEQTATYWPPVPLSLAALLSCSAGLLNWGSWGPIALCWVLVLSTASYLQLTRTTTNGTSCRTGLYHCLMPTCFLWASHLHPIQPIHSQGYTLISSTRCTCSLIDGWVEGQYVTKCDISIQYLDKPKFQSFATFNYLFTDKLSIIIWCLLSRCWGGKS